MNIQQFQYVLAVAELKQFQQAAEKCFVSQSTLSTMIGKLEDEMGLLIFDRSTKPVSITREGVEIVKRLRIIMKEIETLDYKVQEFKGSISGELKIGIIPTIAPYLLPLFLSKFIDQYSKLKISVQEMTTIEIQKLLKNRSIDVGIAAIPLEDDKLVETPLYDEPFQLLDYFSEPSGSEKVSLEKINYSRLILLEEGHCLRNQVRQICNLSHSQIKKSSVNFEFMAGSIDSLIRFTRAHKGITLLPQLATTDFGNQDNQYLKEFNPPVPIRTVGILTHQHFVKKGILKELKEIICQSLPTHLDIGQHSKLIHPF